MAASEADCEAMLEASRQSDAKLMVAYRLHFEPGTVEMVERAHSGELGELKMFTSTFTQTVKPTNHRVKNGFDAGPVLDMGPYPLNKVRQLFGEEPIEVMANGTTTPGSELGTSDNVTVFLRFPKDRLAQFTLSYSLPSSERFQLMGTKGEIEASPCFGFGEGVAITYRATLDGETKEYSHPVVDQFAGETTYFSDCILNGQAPEPDAEEGWRDVRVLAAVKRSLETGMPQKLESLAPKRSITKAQRQQFAWQKLLTTSIPNLPLNDLGIDRSCLAGGAVSEEPPNR